MPTRDEGEPHNDSAVGSAHDEYLIRQSHQTQTVNDAATRHFIHSGRRRVVCRATAKRYPGIPVDVHRSIFPLRNPSSIDVLVFWKIPSQGRSGYLLVTGLTLGADHAPLKELIDELERAKVKRSMFAETQNQRVDLVQAVKTSEWNTETDPLAVTVKDGAMVSHDFSKGCVFFTVLLRRACTNLPRSPARIPVPFVLRNLSLTNPTRYTLRLAPHPEARPASSYVIRLNYASGPLIACKQYLYSCATYWAVDT